jgi:beta-barrel assembly-enhancing protease
MLRRLTCLLLSLALVLSLWPPPASALMSLEEERKIGRQAVAQILAGIPLIHDPDIVDYVKSLGRRLEAFVPYKPFKFRFYVADLGELNAFAIPGGYIFMFRGMMTTLESEAELAGVLAHEMGHVWRRHLANRVEKASPISLASMAGVLAGLLVGALAGSPQLGQAIAIGSQAGAQQKMLSFSRQDEQEADWAAFKVMDAAGYPAAEMAKSYERIWQLERTMGSEVPVYLRTHPTSPSRMEAVHNMVRHYGAKKGSYNNDEFMRIQIRLIALYDEPQQALVKLSRRRLDNPESPYPLYGLALWNLRSHNYETAIDFFKRLNQLWFDNPYLYRDEGICQMEMGHFPRAQTLLKRALSIRPKDREAMLGLGMAYQRNGDLAQAEQTFLRLLALGNPHHVILRELGVTLGRMGRVGEASLYLGLSFKQKGRLRSARYHLNRAVSLLSGQPELQAQAKTALEEVDDTYREKQQKQRKKQEEKDEDPPNSPWGAPSSSLTMELVPDTSGRP